MNKLVDAYHETLADGDHEPVYDPDAMFKPLNPEFEYVDVTDYELEMAYKVQSLTERLAALEKSVNQIALNALSSMRYLKRLSERLDAQSTAAQQSAIILPDRFN